MSAEVAVRVQNVSKTYRIYDKPEHRLVQMATLGRVRRFKEFSALKDVSLEVRRGETVGIVGRNGCGKSTLLQIICGTLQPSGGHVEVNGRVAALLELGAGFNGEFTGRENVYMNGAILGFSREEMDARFDQIAAFAGIGDFIERPVKTYSSGMFVRLAFAVATAVEPDILIVDEALAVGDEAFQRKCFARIEAIKERGGTILFVSHSAQSVVQLCDRAVLLDGGEKLLVGKPKTVVTQYQRLVNADADSVAKTRASILELVTTDAPAESADGDEEEGQRPPTSAEIANGIVQTRTRAQPVDRFDPELLSQSTTTHERHGAEIRNVRLLNMSGDPVNIIHTGYRYAIEYETEIFCESRDVGFGFGITTTTGLHITGAKCRLARADILTGASTVLSRFEFECVLLPGIYFVTCHVRGRLDSDEISLHRIADAIMFRVEIQEESISAGLVDTSIVVSNRILGAA